MASTSSSANNALQGAVLRLRQQHGPSTTLPLHPLDKFDDGSLVLQSGSVSQNARYEVELLFPKGTAPAQGAFLLSVNGEDYPYTREGEDCPLQALVQNKPYEGFRLNPAKKRDRIFTTVYGFARIAVAFADEDGACYGACRAKDIVCLQPEQINAADVEAMLASLTTDPLHNRALQWMLPDEATGDEGYSLIDGGYGKERDRSVGVYLKLIEEGLDAVEKAIPSLKVHAASRMQQQQRIVSPDEVRRFGSKEAMWLAANQQVLHPSQTKSAGIPTRWGYLAPQKVATFKMRSDLDVYENKVILGFVDNVILSLTDFQTRLERDGGACLPLAGGSLAATGSAEDESFSFLLVAMRILQRRMSQYGERAESLRHRAIRIKGMLQHVMPGVRAVDLRTTPLRKTKVFKGLQAYSQVFTPIERFVRFGETPFIADGLALSILRFDRLYEVYGLYRILNGLLQMGYNLAESPTGSKVSYIGTYEEEGPHQRSVSPVCNVYELQRGDTSIRLLYEPSVYADEREFHGCTLHRLWQHGEHYLPDYVLIAEDPTGRRTFVLDAKYSRRASLLSHPDNKNGLSRWESCVGKYLRGIVDAQTGRLPDALWLLSGVRDDEKPMMTAETQPWATQDRRRFESGVFNLVPGADTTLLLEAMGLGCNNTDKRASDNVRFLDANRDKIATWEEASKNLLFPSRGGNAAQLAPAEEKDTAARTESDVLDFGSPGNLAHADTDGLSCPQPADSTLIQDDEAGDMQAAASEEHTAEQLGHTDTADSVSVDKTSADLAIYQDDIAQTPQAVAEDMQDEGRSVTPKPGQGTSAKAKRTRKLKEKKLAKQKLIQEQKRRKQQKAQEKREAAIQAKQQNEALKIECPQEKQPESRDAVAEIVAQIIEQCDGKRLDDLFDAAFCRYEMTLDKPLLRKTAARDYRLINVGDETVFYYASRRPDHRVKLSRFLTRIKP